MNTLTPPSASQLTPLTSVNAQYKVTPATIDDLPNIVAIYNQSIAGKKATADLTPVSVVDRQAWFEAHDLANNRPIYVVKNSAGEMAAWGSFSNFHDRAAYRISSEISIYVAQEHQRQGLAKQLLAWMLQQAPNLNIDKVIALIFAHNEGSLALFKGQGFEQWGRLPQVCDMDGFIADVVILGKTICK